MHTQFTRLAAAIVAALAAARPRGRVSADEAKALGTTLTAVGAEKAANKDGTIPAYTGGADHAAGRLQGRRRHPPEPVRRARSRAWRSTPRTWRSTPRS